jgi:ribosomal protein L21
MSGANEWLTLIAENQSSKVDKIGKEWKTRLELQKQWKYSFQYTCKVLSELIEKNKVEKKGFRVMKDKKIKIVPYYRIIK